MGGGEKQTFSEGSEGLGKNYNGLHQKVLLHLIVGKVRLDCKYFTFPFKMLVPLQ